MEHMQNTDVSPWVMSHTAGVSVCVCACLCACSYAFARVFMCTCVCVCDCLHVLCALLCVRVCADGCTWDGWMSLFCLICAGTLTYTRVFPSVSSVLRPSLPCRYGNMSHQYKVRVGDHHSLVPEEHEEEYGVHQILLHPHYNYDSKDYDLALVRLLPGPLGQTPGHCVSLSRHVRPVCLPVKRERVLKQASNCHITGWGDTGGLMHVSCVSVTVEK